MVQKMLPTQQFVLITPKEGPMRSDFEELGVAVFVMDPTNNEQFLDALQAMLIEMEIGALLCNTIMRCDVVCLAAHMNLPCAWVFAIHSLIARY